MNERTRRDLCRAMNGEWRAEGRYRAYAALLRQAGEAALACEFDRAADNERCHAALWRRALGMKNDAATLLAEAAQGELAAWSEKYERWALRARETGDNAIAEALQAVGDIERAHNQRFCALLDLWRAGAQRVREQSAVWECLCCGRVSTGTHAPLCCPLCGGDVGLHRAVAESLRDL